MTKTKNHLQIVKGLSFPIEIVTKKDAFIGMTGSGKTYGAGKYAEEMLDHGVQVVVLDPVGVWYGLRLSADGKKPGFNIVIFGGEYADVPINEHSGELIANIIVERGISAVIDVSHMRKAERKRFVTAFCENFYFLKKKNRSMVKLMIEEAQTFCPQNVLPGDQQMLGAIEDIVKLGRNYGIGVTLISQRPQSVHKDCLNQTEVLFCFQINGSHERKAIDEWVVNKGLDKKVILNELSTLNTGQCFLWSPRLMDVFQKVTILPKKTFDASSTPGVGTSARVKPKKLEKGDLEKISNDIKKLLDEKKENDPAELRKLLTEARRELAKGLAEKMKPVLIGLKNMEKVKQLLRKGPEVLASVKAADETISRIRQKQNEELSDFIKQYNEEVGFVLAQFDAQTNHPKEKPIDQPITAQQKSRQREPLVTHPSPPFAADQDLTLPKNERKILNVLGTRKDKPSSKTQIAVLTYYSVNSGGFNSAMAKLREKGYTTGSGSEIYITPEGLAAVGPVVPLPTGEELHEYWYRNLNKCEAAILKYLIGIYPYDAHKGAVAGETGYSENSGGFNSAISKLRLLQLVSGKGMLKAAPELFE